MYKNATPLALILLALAYGVSERQDPPPPPAGPGGMVLIDFGPAYADPIEVEVQHRRGMTALDALQEVAEVTFTQVDPTHPKAIDAINGVRTDLENSRFWMLDINGEHAMKMPQDIPLLAGFEVKFSYMTPPVVVTLDYGPANRRVQTVPVPFEKGMTVLDALMAAADVKLTEDDPLHPKAIASINGIGTNLELGHFWLYDVNGQHPTVMADAFELGAGFEVSWTLSTPADRPADEPAQEEESAQQEEEPAQQEEAPAQQEEAPAQQEEEPAQQEEEPGRQRQGLLYGVDKG